VGPYVLLSSLAVLVLVVAAVVLVPVRQQLLIMSQHNELPTKSVTQQIQELEVTPLFKLRRVNGTAHQSARL